jgi:hypothetical protein
MGLLPPPSPDPTLLAPLPIPATSPFFFILPLPSIRPSLLLPSSLLLHDSTFLHNDLALFSILLSLLYLSSPVRALPYLLLSLTYLPCKCPTKPSYLMSLLYLQSPCSYFTFLSLCLCSTFLLLSLFYLSSLIFVLYHTIRSVPLLYPTFISAIPYFSSSALPFSPMFLLYHHSPCPCSSFLAHALLHFPSHVPALPSFYMSLLYFLSPYRCSTFFLHVAALTSLSKSLL